MGIHQDRPAGSEPDIDQLFAPEPALPPAPAPPALIFTEPIDSHDQQFADEADVFEERPVLPGREPAALQADARWTDKEAAVPADLMLRFFQVAAALVVFVGALFLLLMPNGSRQDVREARGPRQLSLPPETASAATDLDTAPPAEGSQTAPSRQAVARPRELPAPASTQAVPSRQVSHASATDAAGLTAVRRAAARTPALPAAAPNVPPAPVREEVTSAPQASPAASGNGQASGSIPTLDVQRLATDAGNVIGLPLPATRVPATNVAHPPAPETVAPAVSSTPTGTSGVTAVDPGTLEQGKVRALLSKYEAAYSDLDAGAAARLYPSIDRKALSHAFEALASQQILFEDCRIQVANATARATCAGTASWTPKVGNGFRQQARRWQFDLKQVSGDWQIGKVQIQ